MINIQISHDMKPFMEEDRIVVSAKVNIVDTLTDTVLATNAISMSFGLSPIKSIISFDNNGNIATQDTLFRYIYYCNNRSLTWCINEKP